MFLKFFHANCPEGVNLSNGRGGLGLAPRVSRYICPRRRQGKGAGKRSGGGCDQGGGESVFEGSEDETVIRHGYNVLGIMFLFIFFSKVRYDIFLQ